MTRAIIRTLSETSAAPPGHAVAYLRFAKLLTTAVAVFLLAFGPRAHWLPHQAGGSHAAHPAARR